METTDLIAKADANMNVAKAQKLLVLGIKKIGLTTLPESAIQQLLEFAFLIQKWNKVYNLTAIDRLEDIVTHHFLDSLAVVPYITKLNGEHPRFTKLKSEASEETILDVGTGAGLPGIPIAIALPNHHIYLLESKAKKSTFLKYALLSLKINNATVVQSRIENYAPGFYFDTIISRATMSVSDLLEKSSRLCVKHGQLLVMKGKYPQNELGAPVHINLKLQYAGCIPIHVPFLNEERHLIQFTGRKNG